MEIQQPEISYLIQELRRRAGLTQKELALKIGVSFTSLNRWEKQRQMPLPLALRRIEEVLRDMGDRDLLEQYFPNKENW